MEQIIVTVVVKPSIWDVVIYAVVQEKLWKANSIGTPTEELLKVVVS